MGTHAVSVSSPIKKPQPIPWTNQETFHLIQAYQDKWYSMERSPLKATHWEEVAVTVALRCGYDHSNPSAKSGIQCRHKIEKLRKRYRSEKQRAPVSSSWNFFNLMDCLLNGPLPLSALPPVEIEEEEDDSFVIKSESIDNIDGRWDDEVFGVRLAEEIRGFAGRIERMEKRKIKVMREFERRRVEMENKRIQMIVDSQRKMVDIIENTFGDNKKPKIDHLLA